MLVFTIRLLRPDPCVQAQIPSVLQLFISAYGNNGAPSYPGQIVCPQDEH